MLRGRLSRRCCRRPVRVAGDARLTCAPSSTQSSICCGPAASGACFRGDFPAWGTLYVKGRKRHILVHTLGFPIANRVEPASIPDRRAGALLLGGLAPLFPRIQTVMADAGHESKKLARKLFRDNGWKQIVERRERAFRITGLTWIVERTFAWLGRNRRLSKDNEYAVHSSETMIDVAAIRLMLNRLTAS